MTDQVWIGALKFRRRRILTFIILKKTALSSQISLIYLHFNLLITFQKDSLFSSFSYSSLFHSFWFTAKFYISLKQNAPYHRNWHEKCCHNLADLFGEFLSAKAISAESDVASLFLWDSQEISTPTPLSPHRKVLMGTLVYVAIWKYWLIYCLVDLEIWMLKSGLSYGLASGKFTLWIPIRLIK